MSLLTGFNVTLPQVNLLAQAAISSFAGAPVPSGWSVVTPAQLGLPSKYWDGPYFTDPDSGASAIVLQQGMNYIVSFRGTDGSSDVVHYPELVTNTYINHFQPLLSALSASAPAGSIFSFTGASLGGGATNELADIAASQFGGRFASATFVAFASPVVTEASHILNLGFENDPIFKALNGYADFVSSTDNLVVATAEYMAGNYDGQHPLDDYAHDVALSFAALSGLAQSRFYPLMSPDSVVIFDANLGLVQDITPGREATGAFYLGQDISDIIAGRAGNDFIEGFGGNDTVQGGPGNDNLDGGVGTDTALYSGVSTDFSWHQNPDGTWTVTDLRSGSADGTDTLFDIETLSFSDKAVDLIATVPGAVLTGGSEDNVFVGGAGEDTITGNGGNDVLLGGGGADYISSGDGNDKAFGEAGNDTVIGGNGDDYLNGGADDDLVVGNEGADTLLGDTGNDYLDGGAGDDLVMGGAGNDTVLGADGNDYVNGEAGNDLVFGGDGVDTLLGADGDDYLNGENGNDIVFGDGGNDTVIGGEGNDYLSAGAGDDNLVGGNGNDTLFAGAGSDYLQGDAGDDFFVFDGTFQTSIIIDFEPGTVAHHDVIQFTGGIFTNFADLMSHAAQSATNTVITDTGGHTLTLANVVKANLISDDFVFV